MTGSTGNSLPLWELTSPTRGTHFPYLRELTSLITGNSVPPKGKENFKKNLNWKGPRSLRKRARADAAEGATIR